MFQQIFQNAVDRICCDRRPPQKKVTKEDEKSDTSLHDHADAAAGGGALIEDGLRGELVAVDKE